VVIALALGCLLLLAGPALAKQSGCPVGSGWDEVAVAHVAATVWPALVDQSPWPGGESEFLATAIAPFDRNGDTLLCMKTMWDDLNPNAKWFGVNQYLVRDNTANANNH
jgi:hypothetical protein